MVILSTLGLLSACGDGVGAAGPAGGSANTGTNGASELHIVCDAENAGPSSDGGSLALDPTAGGATACGGSANAGSTGQSASGAAGAEPTAGAAGVATSTDPIVELLGSPMVFAPTATSFSVSAVVTSGNPEKLEASLQEDGTEVWSRIGGRDSPAADVAEWTCTGLEPGRRFRYQIVASTADGGETVLFTGTATTQRPAGSSFTFALLTDTHVAPREVPNPGNETYCAETLAQVARDIAASSPDFVVHLGDVLDFHRFGFVVPPPDGSWTRLGYVVYRGFMGETLGNAAHFNTLGNWDGENGHFTDEEIAYSRAARLNYIPGPTPTTYPEGGSEDEDYYAFTWGDALFIVLNVESYTTTAHRLSWDPGVADDWTLGEAQMEWFRQTLENATSPWRFVMIHHTVGGNAAQENESAYGRGGGQAAYVGEQAEVHELMTEHDVQIFFYGHDHVFTDMVVDNIHYTLPGSAGAPTSWMFDENTTGYTSYWPESGHGRVEVSSGAVHVEFLGLGGTLLHEYTLER